MSSLFVAMAKIGSSDKNENSQQILKLKIGQKEKKLPRILGSSKHMSNAEEHGKK